MIDLKGKKIFVITSPELGWDCVIGVYIANSRNDVIESALFAVPYQAQVW